MSLLIIKLYNRKQVNMHLVSLAKDAKKKFVFEVTISMDIRLYLKE